ncbi:MAG TPA: 6-phosphofructokinase [Clostridiales bacterium]|jgi:6-phosphofructokinase 1|nr:6-phosphofructokinase [Clostridiales bacterium]
MAEKLRGACIIGQSGGPSAVINSSIYGAIKTAMEREEITRVLGASHGIVGVISGELFDLDLEDPEELALLPNTPASALGSCRYKIADPDKDETDCKRILDIFKRYNVRYFFYNGGNDSMDTCEKISRYLDKVGYECRVIGIPKTIDNDLYGTDHCPGFGSAAKYIATSLMEISKDTAVYDTGAITIVEIMGRNAGWLTASSALARDKCSGCGPDLIYPPEVVFDFEKFLDDVHRLYLEKKNVLVAVSEGVRDKTGKLISQYSSANMGQVDAFGHVQLGGLAAILASFVKARTGAKVRGIELSLLQRCAAHCASQTDIDEAFMAGKAAVEEAIRGANGVMVGFEREYINGKYTCKTKLVPLKDVANYENKLPIEWITTEGNDVTQDFIDYALPLIQGEPTRKLVNSLPRFARLKKIPAKES